MSAQIQWLINHELEEARIKHGIRFSSVTVRNQRNSCGCTIHYAGAVGFGETIADAASDLASRLLDAKEMAEGKRREAERLLSEAEKLESSTRA